MLHASSLRLIANSPPGCWISAKVCVIQEDHECCAVTGISRDSYWLIRELAGWHTVRDIVQLCNSAYLKCRGCLTWQCCLRRGRGKEICDQLFCLQPSSVKLVPLHSCKHSLEWAALNCLQPVMIVLACTRASKVQTWCECAWLGGHEKTLVFCWQNVLIPILEDGAVY